MKRQLESRLLMPEISEEEFVANIGKEDFLLRYGNPVLIREKNGDGLVCMAVEYYERLMKELDVLSKKLGVFREDEKIRYWIYEFEMPQEDKDKLEQIAAENEMTMDEFCETALLSAIGHPEEAAAVIREYEQNPDIEPDIRLVRRYPVYKWETQAQALKRAIAEEETGKAEKVGKAAEAGKQEKTAESKAEKTER